MEDSKIMEQQQYDRFINQLRIEVDQMFWLYNFFFLIDSAFFGALQLQNDHVPHPLAVKIAGLSLSIYWIVIMHWKNASRNWWLKRIQELEDDQLKIPLKLTMWPGWRHGQPQGGLWFTLFALPVVFVLFWLSLILK
jgi:hypothetical protein